MVRIGNIFLSVLNPTREKDSQENSRADVTNYSAPQRSQHHLIISESSQPSLLGVKGRQWRGSGSSLRSTQPALEGRLPRSQKLPLSKSPESSLIIPWSPIHTHPWINPEPTFHASDHQILPMLHINSRWPYVNLRLCRRGEP